MPDTPDNKTEQSPPKSFIELYVIEFFQALIAILVIKIAMEKPIEIGRIIWESALIGLLTYILEQHFPEYNSNIRQGISFTIGSQLMSRQFM
ncbi:MAG: hypothetical protein EBU90_15025 [Proteobacteria bacterium]|nr:hypothetical protein [Pseudomonadota bacterium]NBP15309.1 hypothetical protein [bacterium]